MAILERDVVLQGRQNGQETIDLPITALRNVEDSADAKNSPADGDYVPVIDSADNGQMKKTPLSEIRAGLVPTTRKVNGLQLSSDIHLTPPDLGAASGVQLLDNAYWANRDEIINQRGQMEYTTAGYVIDRWVLSRGSIELTPNGLKILKSTDQSSVVLFQYIENSIPMEIPVVLSALVDEKLIAMRRTAIDETIYFGAMALRIESHINPMCLNIYAIDDEPHIISAMKFELGSQQTLAHQDAAGNWVLNDPPPNKALELAKCQRYYQPIPQYTPAIIVSSGDSDTDLLYAGPPMRNRGTVIHPEEISGDVTSGHFVEGNPSYATTHRLRLYGMTNRTIGSITFIGGPNCGISADL